MSSKKDLKDIVLYLTLLPATFLIAGAATKIYQDYKESLIPRHIITASITDLSQPEYKKSGFLNLEDYITLDLVLNSQEHALTSIVIPIIPQNQNTTTQAIRALQKQAQNQGEITLVGFYNQNKQFSIDAISIGRDQFYLSSNPLLYLIAPR